MKKKLLRYCPWREFGGNKFLLVMKLSLFLMFAMSFAATANVNVMSQPVSVDFHDAKLSEVFRAFKEQSGRVIVFSDTKVDNENYKVTLKMDNVPLSVALEQTLKGLPYSFSIIDDVVYIIPSPVSEVAAQAPRNITVGGRVVDQSGNPLVGVTVLLKGTRNGTSTDSDGKYSISWNETPNAILVFTFVGMAKQEIAYTGQREINVRLAEDVQAIEEVVVTGYFSKTKQSITGSEIVVSGKELRQVGSLNFMNALSTFDPSVRPIPNNEYGSDPNRVPEIVIRGENGFDLRSSADDSRSNPNSPLYILDGVEVSATRIYDLDMNRIDAFSILKDAAATALYGSRGANGVILIQTIAPREGEIRVTFNANYNVSFPDLRDYNLMNASEKLAYEKLAGLYTAAWLVGATQDELDYRYNFKLAEIARGVDTYWLSRPLRTSLNQRYSFFIEGGDSRFRYGIDLNYDNDKGVMKGSDREKIGANFNFSYNISNKLRVINDISVDNVDYQNSPYGWFSDYAMMNPYERIYDPQTGEMKRRFGYGDANDIVNPLINSLLPNYDKTNYTEIKDNLSLEWRITDHFLVRGKAALTMNIQKAEMYLSPYSSEFDIVADENERGSYTTIYLKALDFDSNVTVQYNNTIADKYTMSLGAGMNVVTQSLNGDGYIATGFLNDKMNYVQYAHGFKKDSRPLGFFNKKRMIGFFANVNIGYDNRYFIESTFRTDGSSLFGRESRFAPFWSVGAAWNVNNEKWWTIDGYLKIRGSAGIDATTNFAPDQAITKYIYGPEYEYNGYNGAVLSGYGNPALKWQSTLKYNVGFDLTILKNFLVFNGDFYVNKTQNLLLNIDVPASTGFLQYTENMGSIQNIGVEGRMRFNIIRNRERDLAWSVTLMAAANRNKILSLSNALEAMNEEANKLDNVTSSTPLRTYQVGRSQNALMVVQSGGIDPATGNEIYIKLNGDRVFDYDPRDKVFVGNKDPKIQGSFQTNLSFKGFDLFAMFGYQYGAVIYNATLATKVEGVNPRYNADRRVLYERWKEPGDIAMFRRIDDETALYQTSRLVQDNNYINLQSLSLSYTVPAHVLRSTFIERMRFMFSTTDLFRISTIKMERGTIYPFAQTFSLGANITF